MKAQLNQSTESYVPLAAHPRLSLVQFTCQSGLSPAARWRYRKNGWLRAIIIAGRHYVRPVGIFKFNKRAGEFAGTVNSGSASNYGLAKGPKPTPVEVLTPVLNEARRCADIEESLPQIHCLPGETHFFHGNH